MARVDDVARRELVASVAALYHLDGLDQRAIAATVGLSRSTVSRMLTEARRLGIVRIEVDRPLPRDEGLEERVVASGAVRGALVVADPADGLATPSAARVGALAAHHLRERLPQGGTLAISWGETVAAVAAALPHDPARRTRVVQMIGASGTARPAIDGPGLAHAFAARLGGQHRTLNAPLVVDDADLAAALVRQPAVAQVLEEAAGADLALLGLGTTDPRASSLLRAGCVSRDELQRCADLGIVGDAGGHMLDADGAVVASELGARMVRLDEAALRGVREVVAVAHGPAKVAVVRAALRSGLVHVLVSDAATVRAVLAEAHPTGTSTTSRGAAR